MDRVFSVLPALIVITSLVAGCSDGRPRRVPVSGQVLVDGEPLPIGAVRFYPEEGRPATGELDDQGRFTLSTFEAQDGCPLGVHRVAVVSVEDLNTTTRRWNIPKDYASPRTSGITQVIDGPTDSLRMELTWGTKTGPIIERYYGE